MGLLRSNAAFRRLMVGRLVTDAGDSLYYVAATWLVWELTGDPLYTGLAAFLTRAPAVLGALVGPLVDRWQVRRVLVATQAAQDAVALVVPLADAAGALSAPLVLAVMPVLAGLDQFTGPAQNAALPRLVDDADLARANSLYATVSGGADAVFNGLSGLLVAALGAVTLYVVDAATFAAATVLFAGLRVPARDDAADRGADQGYRRDLLAGVRYLRGSALLAVVGGALAVNAAGAAAFAVLPAFAAGFDGSTSYGVLLAAYSLGTVTGTAVGGAAGDYPSGRVAAAGFLASGACVAGLVVVGWFPAVVVLLAGASVPFGVVNVLLRSLVQSTVDEGYLGRVSALIASGASAAAPAGALLGGALAGALGVTGVLVAEAAAVTLLGLLYAAHPRLRRLPAVTAADAADLGLAADAR